MPRRSKNKKRTEVMRADPEFSQELRKLGSFRYIKGLEKKKPTDAEMTRLMRRTKSWNQLKIELQLKPRKEDI